MLIDSHCHIPSEKYALTPSELIADAKSFGVEKFITIGTSLADSEIAKDTAQQHPEIFYSVAIYPHEEKDKNLNDAVNELENKFLVNKDSKLVAIGECGVDISVHPESRELSEQLSLFEDQIKLAVKYNLPLIIHNRNGDEHVLSLLTKYVPQGLRGVIHCFDSNWDFAQKILDLGFYISFSGMITYPKKDYLVEVVQRVPFDKFLVETDAPYLAPQRYRGQVNYPKYVRIVAEKVATIKNMTLEDIEKLTYENTSKLFVL